MLILKSDSEIATLLSQRIKQERIIQQLKQEDLATRADVSISVVRSFEQSAKITFKNLISILRALGKTSIFEDLFDFKKERIELDAFEYSENLEKSYNKKRVKK